jgi:hypothetical protein
VISSRTSLPLFERLEGEGLGTGPAARDAVRDRAAFRRPEKTNTPGASSSSSPGEVRDEKSDVGRAPRDGGATRRASVRDGGAAWRRTEAARDA